MSNQRLVLAGSNEQYDNVTTFIQHGTLLTQFYKTSLRIILEETRETKQVVATANTVGAALLTSINSAHESKSSNSNFGYVTAPNHLNSGQSHGQNRSHKAKGKNNGYKGCGRGSNNQASSSNNY